MFLRKFIVRISRMGLVVAVLSSVGLSAITSHASDERLTVVATTSIVGDWVAHVGGDRIDLTVLVGPDGDVHHVQPTPRQTVALAKADLLFENGLGLEEPWLNRLYRASNTKAKRVILAEGLSLIHGPSCCPHTHATDSQDVEHHGHDHTHEWDPHIWMDPTQVIIMVEKIKTALAEASPGDADYFDKRAREYQQSLEALHDYITSRVATLPVEKRMLITHHATFNYYARRYDLKVVATILESFSTDANEPSARRFANLVQLIHEQKIPAVFAENTANPTLANQLAREAKLPQPARLYTDALGPPGTPGDTYLSMMRWNTDTIIQALQP